MSVYVQYGKVGKPIKYTTLPTASATLNGVIGQVGEDIYLCNGTTGKNFWSAHPKPKHCFPTYSS